MATTDEEMKVLDLESQGGEGEQEALKRSAQTDKVVRGVNGSVMPRARKSSTFDEDRGNRHAPLPPLRRAD